MLNKEISWRRTWQPTPVLLPGKFHGWRSLVDYSPWGHRESDTAERLHFLSFYSCFYRRKWQPTPVFLPGESHGRRGLVGYSLWGCKELDMTKQLTHTHTHTHTHTQGDLKGLTYRSLLLAHLKQSESGHLAAKLPGRDSRMQALLVL